MRITEMDLAHMNETVEAVRKLLAFLLEHKLEGEILDKKTIKIGLKAFKNIFTKLQKEDSELGFYERRASMMEFPIMAYVFFDYNGIRVVAMESLPYHF